MFIRTLAALSIVFIFVGTAASWDRNDDYDFLLVRYRSHMLTPNNGSLDPPFGSGGRMLTHFGRHSQDWGTSLALDSARRIVVAGITGDNDIMVLNNTHIAFARYTTEGDLDTSFSGDGILSRDVGAILHSCKLAIDSEDRMTVALRGSDAGISSDSPGFWILRFTSTGSYDGSFSDNGRLYIDFDSATNEQASAIAIDSSGRTVVAGSGRVDGKDQFLLARYNEDGSLDTTFDGDGKVVTPFPSFDVCHVRALAIDASGKILVAGYGHEPDIVQNVILVARYNADGSLDTSFKRIPPGRLGIGPPPAERDGLGRYRLYSSLSTYVHDMAIDSRGRIVLAGMAQEQGYSSRVFVVRLESDGRRDCSFNHTGLADLRYSSSAGARGVAIDSDDKIVISGYVRDEGLLTARYKEDGTLDRTFDGDGISIVSVLPSGTLTPEREEAYDVLIDSNGRITAAGTAGIGRLCTPLERSNCSCGEGLYGTKMCSADGSAWGNCRHCQICVPGTTRSCTCSSGRSGVETCETEGSGWSDCACAEPEMVEDTRTISLVRQTIFAGVIPYEAGFGSGIDGNLVRIGLSATLRDDLAVVSFLKQGREWEDCYNIDDIVVLTPGGETDEDDLEEIFGSSTPRLPVAIAACYTPLHAGDAVLETIPIRVTYTHEE